MYPTEIHQRRCHGDTERRSTNARPIESLQIIVTVPVLLDLLLCHSRAWLPREESRSFPTSSSGIRDSSRAPDTRAGTTEKFDRAGVRVTMVCAGLNSRVLKNPAESQNGYWLPFNTLRENWLPSDQPATW